MRCFLVALTVLVGALSASATLAQSESSDDRQRSAAVEAEARSLFEAGRSAFDIGRYEDALEHFQQAYELSGRSSLLYNVGQTADRLRLDAVALEAFERFLADNPEHARAEAVRARIRVLREAVSHTAAPIAGEPEPSTRRSVVPSPEAVAESTAEPTAEAVLEAQGPDIGQEESTNTGMIIGLSVGGGVVVVAAVVLIAVLAGGSSQPVTGNFAPNFEALEHAR